MGSFDVPLDDERTQLDAFIEEYRNTSRNTSDGLTEEQSRRLIGPVSSILGCSSRSRGSSGCGFRYASAVRPCRGLGPVQNVNDSYRLTDDATIASVTAAYRDACATARMAVADLPLNTVVTGHRTGPRTLHWVYLQVLRELAHHCAHDEHPARTGTRRLLACRLTCVADPGYFADLDLVCPACRGA